MTTRLLLALALTLTLVARAPAQMIYTPQSGAGLSVHFQSERMGPSRMLLFGEVRNSSGTTFERVILLAEGIDETGKVVSRARAYVPGTISPKGNASFELRLLAAGSERHYRVTIESFQQLAN